MLASIIASVIIALVNAECPNNVLVSILEAFAPHISSAAVAEIWQRVVFLLGTKHPVVLHYQGNPPSSWGQAVLAPQDLAYAKHKG